MFRRDLQVRRVVVCCGRTDLRRGIDSLVAFVRLNYGMDPLEKGTLFLFCGRKKDRIKGLCFEGDGWTLLYKRLTFGRYTWPSSPQEARPLSWEEYDRLMTGFAIESSIVHSDRK